MLVMRHTQCVTYYEGTITLHQLDGCSVSLSLKGGEQECGGITGDAPFAAAIHTAFFNDDYLRLFFFVTHASALCYLEWGGELVGMSALLVVGSSDGRLGFIDVKGAQLLHVRRRMCCPCFY